MDTYEFFDEPSGRFFQSFDFFFHFVTDEQAAIVNDFLSVNFLWRR